MSTDGISRFQEEVQRKLISYNRDGVEWMATLSPNIERGYTQRGYKLNVVNRRNNPAFDMVEKFGIEFPVGKTPNEAWKEGSKAITDNHGVLLQKKRALEESDRNKKLVGKSSSQKRNMSSNSSSGVICKSVGSPAVTSTGAKGGGAGRTKKASIPEPRLGFLGWS